MTHTLPLLTFKILTHSTHVPASSTWTVTAYRANGATQGRGRKWTATANERVEGDSSLARGHRNRRNTSNEAGAGDSSFYGGVIDVCSLGILVV